MRRFMQKQPKVSSTRFKSEKKVQFGVGPHSKDIPFEESNYATKMCSLISDYEFYEQIGSGAYAVVVRCKHLTSGNIIAAKIYDKFKMNDSDKKKSLQQEVKIMKRLRHPKIVKLYEVIDTS